MRRPVRITFKRDRRHGYYRACGQSLFKIVIFRLAFCQSEPPSIVMNSDRDVIGIIKGDCTAIKSRCIKVPFRRSNLPNEFGKVVPVFWWSWS